MQLKQRKQSAARVLLALFLTLAGALPLAAADNVPAIKTANTPVEVPFMNLAGVTNDATIGWSFTVGAADIVVSHLGLYDSGADGFLTAHEVAIWTSTGTPVTPATAIPIGTGATLVVDGYRYVAITPVTLNAGGTYVIGAYFPAVPPIVPIPPPADQGDKIIYNSSQTYAAPITFGESRTTALTSTTDPLAFPNVNATLPQGIFGPNFLCSFTELNLDNVTLNEGNASTTSFDFTVSLTQPAGAGGVTFNIATADGTTDPATQPSDYTAKSLTGQTISSTNSTFTFSVLVNGDTDVEPNETFFVNVSNVSGAYLNDGQGLGTITNDDAPPPVILTAEGPAAPVLNGASIAVTIKVAQFTNLGTLQFSVNWDETELQLVDNTPLTIDGDAPLIGNPAPDQLTYTWFDADIDYGVTLPDGTTILTLNFTVLASAPTSGINVDITDTPTTVEASDVNFAIVPVTLNNLVDFEVIAPPPVKPFVFVANKVTLKGTKQSTSTGDVHSNGLLVVEKGKPSTYNSNLTAVGKISIGKYNTVNGNVKSQASVSNSGTITGTKSVGSVANESLPSLSYSAGGLNKTVPNGGSLTLAPGSYGIVTMNQSSTLKLTSGEYFMNELRYSSSIENGRIEIDLSSGDPVTINVVTNLQIGHEGAVVLLPNGESDSKLVTFNTKQTTSANWGREAYLLGSFNAPNAIVTLVKNTQLRGSICAKEILVSNDCLFLHHDSPGTLPGPGNLPKSFSDSDEEVSSDPLTVISDYALAQNYPNPFNPSTMISFQLPVNSDVTLSIFNTSGQLVKKLVAGEMNAGQHTLVWDATNERGERVASGVYLYVIKAGEFTAQRKLVLMK